MTTIHSLYKTYLDPLLKTPTEHEGKTFSDVAENGIESPFLNHVPNFSSPLKNWHAKRVAILRNEIEKCRFSNDNVIAFVGDPSVILDLVDNANLPEKYHLIGVFQMPLLIPLVDRRLELLTVLSKNYSTIVRIGVLDGPDTFTFEHIEEGGVLKPTERLEEYWQQIESWIRGDTTDGDSFYDIPRKSFEISNPYPWNYTPIGMKIQQALSREQTKSLDSLADVYSSSEYGLREDGGVVLLCGKVSYPVNFDNLPYLNATELKLQAGDIVFPYLGFPMLLDTTPPFDLFAPLFSTVVRPVKGTSPEYLFLYLTSDVGRQLQLESTKDHVFNCFSPESLKRIPIVVQKRGTPFYEALFKCKHYQECLTLDALISDGNSVDAPGETVESLFVQEELSWIERIQRRKTRDIVQSDIEEINACYAARAYKATLILAGSVLEAFLTDWLGQLHGKNYMLKPYRVNGVEANLVDYINAIAVIRHPEWMEQKNQANYIRENRNCVHAKLCLRQENAICKETCKKVIEYLKSIVKSRFNVPPA